MKAITVFICWVLLLMGKPLNAQVPLSNASALERGLLFAEKAQFDSARFYFEAAAQNASHEPEKLFLYHALAENELAYSQFDQTKYYLEQAQNILAKRNKLDSLAAQIWLTQSRYHLQFDQYAQAKRFLAKVKRVPQSKISPRLATKINYTEAQLSIRQDQDQKGRQILLGLLGDNQISAQERGLAHGLMGIYFQEQRNWDSARVHYELAVDTLEGCLAERHPKLAMAYLRLGLVRQIKGKGDAALRLYMLAQDIQDQSLPPNHIERVLCYNYLGFYHGRKGDHGQALEYFQQALRILRFQMGDIHRQVASNANNAGNALLKLGRYEEAAENISLAVRVSEQVFGPSHPRVASKYFSLGLSYFNTGQYQKAIAAYQKTLAIRKLERGKDHQSLAEVYNNLGMCYQLKADYDQAIKYFEEAVRIGLGRKDWYDATVARYHNNIGDTYRKLGQAEKAFPWHQKALMHLVAAFREADKNINPSLDNIVDKQVMLEVLASKAQTFADYANEHPEQLASTLATYRLAVNLIDSLRLEFVHNDSKFQLAEAALPVYEGGITTAYKLYQSQADRKLFEDALTMSEKSKAVLLLQSIKDVNARQFAQIPDTLLAQEKALAAQITRLEEQLFKAQFNSIQLDSSQIESWQNDLFTLHRERENLARKLEEEFPEYHKLKYSLDPLDLGSLQQDLLGHEHALIEYFVGTEALTIFYLSGEEYDWRLLPKTINLAEQVSHFRKAIAAPTSTSVLAEDSLLVETGLLLYQWLINPIYEMRPQDETRWLIIPDGVLGYLPFDALLSEWPKQIGNYKSYPFLLAQQAIAYSYSASIWQEMLRKNISAPKGLLAFAPTFGQGNNSSRGFDPSRGGFSPLAHNQDEARAVQKVMGGALYLGKEATESRFKKAASNHQIIHLSSHAKVNDEDPLYSQIAFSQSQNEAEDGVITVAELFDMHLPAEMIVLSACETGIGKLFKGEGISSQAKGFAFAGAKSIITTLWSINDAASADLMPGFYGYLKEGERKDIALHKAKLDYIRRTDPIGAHPFYWAGFVPIGNMAPIPRSNHSLLLGVLALAACLTLAFGLYKRKTSKRLSH
ncbi:MAG: CHAT domain-containing tetratricopeptide repeat protein [Bacteroidota bacterium]